MIFVSSLVITAHRVTQFKPRKPVEKARKQEETVACSLYEVLGKTIMLSAYVFSLKSTTLHALPLTFEG